MNSKNANSLDTHSLPANVFRANVGAVIVNPKGEVLALERANKPGAWQMPQGGLREDEEPIEAVVREVQEETGIGKQFLDLLSENPEWLAYELDKNKRSGKYGRGQVQKWFLFRFKGSPNDIHLENSNETEFVSWKWTTLDKLAAETAQFRRPIYRKLAAEFSRYLKS